MWGVIFIFFSSCFRCDALDRTFGFRIFLELPASIAMVVPRNFYFYNNMILNILSNDPNFSTQAFCLDGGIVASRLRDAFHLLYPVKLTSAAKERVRSSLLVRP